MAHATARPPSLPGLSTMPLIHIWSLSPASVEARFGPLRAVLDVDELRRADRLRREEDRRAWTAAHTLLRHALSTVDPARPADAWTFDRTAEGRPYVASQAPGTAPDRPALDFSLSHTRDWVACAVGIGARCGIDVERVRALSDLAALEQRVLAEAERASLEGLRTEARLEHFYRLWTLKEAWGKATGVGILLPLEHLVFDVAHDDTVALVATPEPEGPAASGAELISDAGDAWTFDSRTLEGGAVVEAVAVWAGTGGETPDITRHD